MLSKSHFMCGIGLSLVLLLLGIDIVPIMIILCVSILIDIDHIFDFVVKFRRWNIAEMDSYFGRKVSLKNSTTPLPLFIFHNFETLGALAFLSYFFPFMIYILAGVIFHIVLDWSVMRTHNCPVIMKLSLTLVLIENRRRRRGYYKW